MNPLFILQDPFMIWILIINGDECMRFHDSLIEYNNTKLFSQYRAFLGDVFHTE